MDQTIVDAIMIDLTDRRGIRQAIEACDLEVRQEMNDTLKVIVRKVLDGDEKYSSEMLYGTWRR